MLHPWSEVHLCLTGAAEQHASFGGELVGGNDTDDDPAAANMDADMDIEGDASGAAGGCADNNQVCLTIAD